MTTRTERPDLIETMRADPDGNIALLDRHLHRLETSARALAFQWPGHSHVQQVIDKALASRVAPDGQTRLRLLLSPLGDVTVETVPLADLSAHPLVALSPLILSSQELWLQHKATYRPWYLPTMTWLAKHSDFFDLIFLNERDELCEGSRSNIYLKSGQDWLTPPLHCGLLGGVVRQHLLATGQVREAVLTRADYDAPDASLRLSNGLRDWFDVRRASHDDLLGLELPE